MEDAKAAPGPETPSPPPNHASLEWRTEARGLSFGVLAVVAVVFALDWAEDFFIPLLVGILIAYMLNPLVNALERIRMPRAVATPLVIASAISALAFGIYSVREEAQTIVNQLPTASAKLSESVAKLRQHQRRNIQQMENAARQLENATKPIAPPPSAPAVQIVVEPPKFTLSNLLITSTKSAVTFLIQAIMVLFLVFFLLLSGETFKRKVVRIAGPTLARRKITLLILDDINRSIQQYMFMLLTTNVLLGILTWIALHLLGVENAGAWAVIAAVLHLIPYFGPAVAAGVIAIAAFVQFDSLSRGMLTAGVLLTIATFIGMFVATWMTGRIAKMNTTAVFISLLFWGWLWGVWGMLLSIPIVVIVKVISQHVEPLHPLAELLAE
jgi:predicted PurR-regulated permease PerM